MTDAMGTYDTSGVVDIELGDDYFDIEPNKPNIPEGTMIFYIEDYEPKRNPAKNSFGYNFTLVPYQDQYGLLVDAVTSQAKLKKYQYVGKYNPETNRIVESGSFFPAFLASIGVGKESDGLQKFSKEIVRGTLVKGDVKWTKALSTRENPNTGQVPTAIDDNDPYTYVIFANIEGELRGVRDEDGEVKRVNI